MGADQLLNYTDTTTQLKSWGLNGSLVDRAKTLHDTLDTYDFTNSGIDVTNIVGCMTPTVGKVVKLSWGRSYLEDIAGDGTVPFGSARTLLGANTTLYSSSPLTLHSEMPSQSDIRRVVANILEGKPLSLPSYLSASPDRCVGITGRRYSVHSPVILNIYDAQGNHLGPTDDGGFEANIPGSSYDTLGDEKFAFVPEGNYMIKLNATDSGHFSFFSSKVENNETVSTASYLDIPIASTSKAQIVTNDANTQTIALDTTGQGTATTTVTPTSVLVGSSTDDITPPITTLTATGTKVGSYYTGNVIVTFSATDTATGTPSGLLKTEYAFDNSTSTIWRTYSTSTPLIATTTTTFYYYSTDKIGNKEAVASTTILIDTVKPSTPSLIASPVATSSIKLTWATSTDVGSGIASYQILRATSSTATTTLIGTTTASTTTFTNIGLTASTTYWYQVRAVDLAGNISSSSNKVSTTTLKVVTDTTPPTTPQNLTASAASSTQVNLTWATSTDNVKVAGYQLERCSGQTCTNFIQIATSTVTNYANTGLTASTTYRFRVRAYDGAGNRSNYSSITTITTPKAPQTIFQDTFESSLTWTKVGAVTWYTGTPKVGTHAVKLTTTASIEKAISLANYQNITISFRLGANSLDTSSENVQALYYNGTAWVTLTTIQNNSTNENNQLNPHTFTLPTTMNNKSTFKLRFKINASATDDAAFVDEVRVGGVGM